MQKIKLKLNKILTIAMQYITLLALQVWLMIFRRKRQIVEITKPIDHNRPTVIVANHMTRLDPTTIYSAFGLFGVFRMVPVKFMTATKYYNSIFKPYLYSIGCYPHKGNSLSGVEGSIYYIKNGYKLFMFPEGKMNKSYKLNHAYNGICKILAEFRNPRVILVNIYWEERIKLFSRPAINIIIRDAPSRLDLTDPYEIMKEIYKLTDKHKVK